MSVNADGTLPYLGLYEGVVIDVDDPKQLHRVRVSIQGVSSKSAWARPKMAGGGAAQRGGNAVPIVGSTVYIQFVNGDLRRPVYEGGSAGAPDAGSELPTDIVAAGADAAQVVAYEFARGTVTVRFTLDEREGHRSWRMVAVLKQEGGGEQVLGSIELDIEKRVVDIFALAGVQLRSLGFVDIRSLTARIQRRRVRRTAAPL